MLYMGITRRKDGRAMKTFVIDGCSKSFYSSEKSDKKAENDIMRQMLEYKGKLEIGKTVSEVAEEWEEWHEERVEASTHRRYKPCTKRVSDWFSDVPIKNVTVMEANRFLETFAQLYPMKKTVKQQKTVCNQIWKYAILKGYVEANNVWQFVPLPKGLGESERLPPSDEILKKVFHTVPKSITPGLLFINILLFSGIRRGEILGLKYSDIKHDEELIYISRQVVHEGNKPVIKDYLKTKAGERKVILTKRLSEIIPKKKSGFIFSTADGKPFTQSQFKKFWKDSIKELSIDENVTPHQFRHAYTSMLHDLGVDEKDAQALLGHADVHTTKQIYMHVSKRSFANAANKLNAYEL